MDAVMRELLASGGAASNVLDGSARSLLGGGAPAAEAGVAVNDGITQGSGCVCAEWYKSHGSSVSPCSPRAAPPRPPPGPPSRGARGPAPGPLDAHRPGMPHIPDPIGAPAAALPQCHHQHPPLTTASRRAEREDGRHRVPLLVSATATAPPCRGPLGAHVPVTNQGPRPGLATCVLHVLTPLGSPTDCASPLSPHRRRAPAAPWA